MAKQAASRGKREVAVKESLPKVKRPGRPKGKRSDPAFEQVTAYLRKDTYRQTKIALLQEAAPREFSELIEDLLSVWLSR